MRDRKPGGCTRPCAAESRNDVFLIVEVVRRLDCGFKMTQSSAKPAAYALCKCRALILTEGQRAGTDPSNPFHSSTGKSLQRARRNSLGRSLSRSHLSGEPEICTPVRPSGHSVS